MKTIPKSKASLPDLLSRIVRAIRRAYVRVRFGVITSRVTATAGDHVPAEIEYIGRGKVVGFYAYGCWDPNLPYRGDVS